MFFHLIYGIGYGIIEKGERTPDGVPPSHLCTEKRIMHEILLNAAGFIVRHRNAFFIYLAAVNLIAFILYALDKSRAKRGAWRIPESRLIGIAVIGGSLGLSPEVLARADYQLSFSRMTFPHQLMRVVLLEQVYRAMTILSGEKYHK